MNSIHTHTIKYRIFEWNICNPLYSKSKYFKWKFGLPEMKFRFFNSKIFVYIQWKLYTECPVWLGHLLYQRYKMKF